MIGLAECNMTSAGQVGNVVLLAEGGGQRDWDLLQSLCQPHHDAKTRRGRKAREDPSAMTEQHRGQRSLRPLPLLTLPLKQHDDAQDADDELGGSEAHRADEDDDVDPRASPNQPQNRMTAPMNVQTPMFNEVRMIVPTNQNIRWAPALTRAPTFTNPNS